MENLQVGKKVKIKDNLVVDNFYKGLRFHSGMNRHKGKLATIVNVPHYNENAFNLDVDLEGYDWSMDMFEVVS